MNTALLRDIYRWYTETDKKEVTKELLAKIEKAREQYFERKDNSKQAYLEESKKKNENGETKKSTNEDKLNEELEKTYSREDQKRVFRGHP
ncbi:hypothetical protein [Tetragenococcus halophilus]|uniref:Uncharacterized protein n=1 Tax=Tetragenococcus halophilus TaxID=51669 RepID=A0AB35HPV5_TETHA|nr:hypothetical protein [Tetragenococcus halophilus]MCO8298172.1 hypothetical protein [Tetragenococcus halophilus]